uniref:heparan-alpha-glucosaminide N-acetyltransferase domain-containing protein n=1 Tax=Pseudorhodoferax sp. TaxID=1993553 RepID=UPI002DD69300
MSAPAALDHASPVGRLPRLDALRASWMLWMAAFHFCFDLAHFRLADWNFYADPFWTLQRTLILSGFLFWAGLGQGLARQSATAFWRRWAQVAGAALLVSAGSALMFPRSWISFGVLHAFALLLPLARWLARAPAPGLLALAAAALLLPWGAQHPLFDSRWGHWTG